MMSQWLFFKKFIAQPSVNASILPSSQSLARVMLHNIDWSKINTIVEFGPGTGIFTQHIVRSMKPGSRCIVVEYDLDYCKLLGEMFGDQITIIHGNVHHLATILTEYHIQPDLIISGLPYIVFTGSDGDKLINYLALIINQGCIMRGFGYSPRRFKKTFALLHPKMVDYTMSCIPPAFVYEMK